MNDDLISRAAAIDILDAYQVMVENGEENPYAWARLRMSELPPAQPVRKKGEWISKGYGEYRCSSCRNIVDLDEEILMSIKMFDYCPVCGADMRGEQDG